MHTETREKTDNYRVYITDDGTEFYSRFSAVIHEAKEMKRLHPREIESTGILTPDEDYIYLYNIKSKEDWDYLYKVSWEQNVYGDTYLSPGWYGAIRRDGGDYADEYEIINIKFLIRQQEDFLKEIKDLTSAKNMI